MTSFMLSMKYFPDNLTMLLKSFFKDNVSKAIEIINKYEYDDKKIYYELRELYLNKSQHTSLIDKDKYIKLRQYNAQKKLDHIKYFLKKYKTKKYSNILDIGCEDCFQVKSIGKYLNIYDYNCINIDNWNINSEVANTSYNLPRNTCNLKLYNGVNIPYENETFDIVMIFQTLHHIKNVDAYILEVKRVMKKNGLLIIREHNCDKKYFGKLIDIEHGLYEIVLRGNMNFFDSYYSNYKSAEQWNKIIDMKLVYTKYLPTATQSYYAIYMNVDIK